MLNPEVPGLMIMYNVYLQPKPIQSPCNPLVSIAHVSGFAQVLAVAEMHCRNVTL